MTKQEYIQLLKKAEQEAEACKENKQLKDKIAELEAKIQELTKNNEQ